jgi:hypothetical protein
LPLFAKQALTVKIPTSIVFNEYGSGNVAAVAIAIALHHLWKQRQSKMSDKRISNGQNKECNKKK